MGTERASLESMSDTIKSIIEEHIANMPVDDLLRINRKLSLAVSILINGCRTKDSNALYEWDKIRGK